MKMTVEIPDGIFRRAKKKAAEEGISLRQFVTEAIEARLQNEPDRHPKPWMRHVGKLKGLRKETRRVKTRPE
jgi:hypothetical protein